MTAAHHSRSRPPCEKMSSPPQVPEALRSLIKSAFPAEQGAYRALINAVLNVLEFNKTEDQAALWGTPGTSEPSAEQAGLGLARAIRSAAWEGTLAMLTSSLDPEYLRHAVEEFMAQMEKNNKSAYIRSLSGEDVQPGTESVWETFDPMFRFGRVGGPEHANDQAYYDALPAWEKK